MLRPSSLTTKCEGGGPAANSGYMHGAGGPAVCSGHMGTGDYSVGTWGQSVGTWGLDH